MELKWVGMSKFNSEDHYIYYCGQESLRRNGVALMVNKRVQNAVIGHILKKQQHDLSWFPRQTIQHYTNPSLYHKHWCQRSWSWLVLWRPTTSSRTNTKTKRIATDEEIHTNIDLFLINIFHKYRFKLIFRKHLKKFLCLMWLWRLGNPNSDRGDQQSEGSGVSCISSPNMANWQTRKSGCCRWSPKSIYRHNSLLLRRDQLFVLSLLNWMDKAHSYYGGRPILLKLTDLNQSLIQKYPHRNIQNNVWPSIEALQPSQADT